MSSFVHMGAVDGGYISGIFTAIMTQNSNTLKWWVVGAVALAVVVGLVAWLTKRQDDQQAKFDKRETIGFKPNPTPTKELPLKTA